MGYEVLEQLLIFLELEKLLIFLLRRDTPPGNASGLALSAPMLSKMSTTFQKINNNKPLRVYIPHEKNHVPPKTSF
jgi:hypothetical protein